MIDTSLYEFDEQLYFIGLHLDKLIKNSVWLSEQNDVLKFNIEKGEERGKVSELIILIFEVLVSVEI